MKRVAIAALCIFALTGGVASAGKLLTGKDIKDGSIHAADLSKRAKSSLAGRRGPRGLPGQAGPQGPQGATGAQGAPGRDGANAAAAVVPVNGVHVTLCGTGGGGGGCLIDASEATCPAGHVATGGGWESTPGKPALTATVGFNSRNAAGDGWIVAMANNGPAEIEFYAVVQCVKGATTAQALGSAPSRAALVRALRAAR